MKILFATLCIILTLSCSVKKTQPEDNMITANIENNKKEIDYLLLYLDLNNNAYYITEKKVVYDPMTPMESSSGEYSGGEPWEKEIDNDVYFEIENTFKKAIENKENHLEQRERISVLIKSKYPGEQERSYIIKPNNELDDYLKSLKTLETLRD